MAIKRLYRTINTTAPASEAVLYVRSTTQAQARSYRARTIVQVEVADPEQMAEDALAGIAIAPVDAVETEAS